MTIEVAQQVSDLLKKKIELETSLQEILDTKDKNFVIGTEGKNIFTAGYITKLKLSESFKDKLKLDIIEHLKLEISKIETEIKTISC